MGKGKIAIGAAIGALIGVAAGILTAPRAGKQTRAELKAKAEDLKRGASEKVEAGKEKTSEVIERLLRDKDKE